MMKNCTWHIHIKGQVQGVGFRPFVYKAARECGLRGWVNNAVDGVHCEFNADLKEACSFYHSLINNAPNLSDITDHELLKIPPKTFDTFQIIHSDAQGPANLLLTPDFAMCDKCRNELSTEANRRYGYPFITCTNCGPRYSIIEKLPYDRETTTMEPFLMCASCKAEYEDPLDRRYYSQTNSCGECAISMSLYNCEKKLLTAEVDKIISNVVEAWRAGKIVAIKGIGGYLFTCDASDSTVIKMLRDRKKRPSKPFALMYPDFGSIERDMILNRDEKEMLANAVSPIVLLNLQRNVQSGICLPEIAPGLSRLGVMIPYTPLYALLLKTFSLPIIATSGNVSGSPIIYSNRQALDELTSIADFVLTNNRDITVPQDDSVVNFTLHKRQKIICRRSRGLAPTYINPKLKLPEETVLATGAMLKSTFTYVHRQNIFISQYLGDLDHFDTQRNYKDIAEHFFDLFDEKPDFLLSDKHPDYFSTRFADQLSNKLNVPVKKFQHHQAHFAAVLGEHVLLHAKEPILGVIWDGTGLGDDGQIWGGEFFVYDDYSFTRCEHLDYFNFIAGDKMSREPRISALATTQNIEGAEALLTQKFSDLEWKNYHTLLQKQDNLQTSSIGRLFDAVSSLLGFNDRQSYEGEAAMLLENAARPYIKQNGISFAGSYLSTSNSTSTRAIMHNIVADIKKGISKKTIAGQFHYSLVDMIAAAARRHQTRKLAFSGGVFQNALLVDMILECLGSSYDLYFHQQLAPNDENISFGQLMCHVIELMQK